MRSATENVLSAAILDDSAARLVVARLQPADFPDRDERAIFGAMRRVVAERGVVDPVLLADELRRAGFPEAEDRLAAIATAAVSPANVERHIEVVRDASVKRSVRQILGEAHQVADDATSGAEVLSYLDGRLEAVKRLQGASGGLQTEGLARLLSRDIPAPPPIIDGRILDEGRMLVLIGPPGSGKTWVILQLVLHLARGDDAWLGARIFGPIRSLVLFGEGGPAILKARVSTILRAIGPLPEGGGVDVWTPGNEAIDLLEAVDLARLEQTIAAGEFGLVVVDPLADFHTGEEDNLTYRRLTRSLRGIMARTGASFVLSHHPRKRGMLSRAGSAEEARGGSALHGAADAFLTLEPDPKDWRTRSLFFPKVKDAAPPRPWSLEQTETGVIVHTGARVRKPGEAKVTGPELLDFLREHGPSTVQDLAAEFRVDRTTILRAMGRLDDASAIVKLGEKRGRADLYNARSRVGS